jgi:hypothetical protein
MGAGWFVYGKGSSSVCNRHLCGIELAFGALGDHYCTYRDYHYSNYTQWTNQWFYWDFLFLYNRWFNLKSWTFG